MSETLVNDPEQFTPQDIGNLMIGALDLVQDPRYPEADRRSWQEGNRQTRNITALFDDFEITRKPWEIKLSVPQFYLGQDPEKFESLDDLEKIPAPRSDYFFEKQDDGSERWRGGKWMKAMVQLNAHYSNFSPVSYSLHASPINHGYARTHEGVILAHASTYDERGSYTPPGFRSEFAKILEPILEHGKTLRTNSVE